MAQYRTDTKKLDQPTVTRYEVNLLGERLTSTGSITDAFGRIRVSNPFTLFDSQHRYKDNEKFDTLTVGTGNTVYKINESVIDMGVNVDSGAKVIRESKRVFSYQPGKSFLVLNTFAFSPLKSGLRQRVGYFGNNNGIYLEANGTNVALIKRSFVTGSIQEERIEQSDWSYDSFDGTGFSAQLGGPEHQSGLDLTKANIFWMDVEWLGVGDVRTGFVVDGQFCPAHTFHNDNKNTTTYMTTACLPVRYEIENVGATSSNSTMKQVCSTVISEGGYQGRNRSRSQTLDMGSFKDLATANTYYPVMSIRMSPSRSDSVVIPKNIDLTVITNTTSVLHYKVVLNSNLVNTSFSDCQGNTVQYDISANSQSNNLTGTLIKSGYITTGQKGGSLDFGSIEEFEIQLGRTISGNSDVITLYTACETAGADVGVTMEWYELI
jgi:hypothetical protein